MSIFDQFWDDNTVVWLDNEGQGRDPVPIFTKDLLHYIRNLDKLGNRPTKNFMWIERSDEEPKLQLVFKDFRLKIEDISSQSFCRCLSNPKYCRDIQEEGRGHVEPETGVPAVRKVLPNIFSCFYLDRHLVKQEYSWNIFLRNDGVPEDQYEACVDMIRQSFFKEQENDQSEPDAEELLFGLPSDKKKELSDKLANGEDVIKTIVKQYTKNIPDVFVLNKKTVDDFDSDIFDFFKGAAEKIVDEVNQQPLMYYLSRKGKDYVDEYRTIVNHTVKFEYGKTAEIKVSAPIGSLHANFRSKLLRYAEKKTFSAHDVMVFLGELAKYASKNGKNGYVIDEEAVFKSAIAGEMPRSVITDLMDEGFLVKIRRNKKIFYKFSIKQTRLIALAEFQADSYNAKLAENPGDLDHIKRITNKILEELLGDSSEIGDFSENRIIDHTKYAFDTVIVYAEVLRIGLDFLLSRRVSDCLILMAQDFTVSRRMQQEEAIALLTYELCEHGNHFLPTQRMEEIFRATYGKNAYKFQVDALPYLLNSSDVYRKIIEEACEKACTLGAKEYSLADPFFIFYYGELFARDDKKETIDTAEAFLRQSCVLESKNWKNILENRPIELSKYKELFDYLKKNPPSEKITSETPKTVVGLNMLLYSAFDVIRDQENLSVYDLYGENSSDVRKHMNRLILFTDYLTRSLSEEYNEQFCRDKADFNSDSMFLPCGAFRLTSIKKLLDDFDPDLRYKFEDNNMVAQYQFYLSHERGRYRILLIRLLALVSTYFDDNDLPLDIKDFKDIQFLDYDGISRRQLNDLRNCLNENGDKKDKKDRIIKILLNIKN